MSTQRYGDYTDMAEYYDHLMLGGYYDYESQAGSLATVLPADGHVLEVGVGTGLLAEQLIRRGFRVTGIDITQSMLDKARALLGDDEVELHRIDLSSDALPGEFDAAISNGGVWYGVGDPDDLGYCGHIIDDEGMARSVKTLLAAVRPGGSLVLSIQPRHAPKTMELPDGVHYEQRIHEKGDGVFDKEYLFTSGGATLARMVLPLRNYDTAWFESLLAGEGFGRLRTTEDGQYVVFGRDAVAGEGSDR